MSLHPMRLEPHIPRMVAILYEALERSDRANVAITTRPGAEDLLAILFDWVSALFEPSSRPRLIDNPSPLTSWIVKRLVENGVALLRGACKDISDGDASWRTIDRILDRELTTLTARCERELVERTTKQALADRMQAMQQLTAGFAHELRNPVNAARLQLEVLELRSGGIPDEHPAALALSELQSISELLDDFLLFARPAPLILEEHDLVTLASQVVEAERTFARDSAVDIKLIADIPPTQVLVDVTKLICVFEELVHNAIEAARGHVAFELRLAETTFRATVCDDGSGIAPELQSRIYEPFFSTKDHRRGLGLSIVHAFVALHHGSIVMTSSSRGSRFAVTLPRRCE